MPHRVDPFKIRSVVRAWMEIGVNKRNRDISAIANKMNELCSSVQNAEFGYDIDIRWRLVSKANLSRDFKMMLVNATYDIAKSWCV